MQQQKQYCSERLNYMHPGSAHSAFSGASHSLGGVDRKLVSPRAAPDTTGRLCILAVSVNKLSIDSIE